VVSLTDILTKSKEMVGKKEKKCPLKKKSYTTAGNQKVVKIIEQIGFSVNRIEYPKEDEYGAKALYYCQYNDWIFPVRDIEKGTLSMENPRNMKTGKKLYIYADLRCDETSKERLRKIKDVMDVGLEAFLIKEYGHYYELPYLLENVGYPVETHDFQFDICENEGYIKVDEECYLRVYQNEKDEMKFVVTNNPKWNANSHNGYWGDKAYFFTYKGKEDLVELTYCIQAFMEEMKGEYGYFEEGKRYTNEYIEDLIQCTGKQLITNYGSKFAHIEEVLKEEKGKTINHYEGLEIFKTFIISLKEKEQEECYRVTFEYDKKKDEKHCILTIDSCMKKGKGITYFEETCELRGGFQMMFKKLKDFMWELYEIHGMKLQ